MDSIFTFAKEAGSSPLILLAMTLVIIILQLVDGRELLKNITGKQKPKYPVLEYAANEVGILKKEFQEVNMKLEKIMGNHLHELPEMRSDIREMKEMMYDMRDHFGNRLTKVETIIGAD